MGLNWSTFFPFKNIISGSNLGKRVAKASIKSSSKTSTVDHPKTLIIAEKPSVANDIAKALGGFTKHEDYFESDDFVISSAVGHLLEIAAPLIIALYSYNANPKLYIYAKLSILGLIIFTILATLIYHFPPIGSNYYSFMSNLSTLGGLLLLYQHFFI